MESEDAYATAKQVLEERYGNPFTISKAFRQKLDQWPKISPKDSLGLRDFSDFLRSCEAAIPCIKGLDVLNDCQENQKILAKLPDWLTTQWNRKVAETEEARGVFPTFSEFVRFVTKEAKIACNPITLLHALRESSDKEKDRTLQPPRKQGVGANTLATDTQVEQASAKKMSEHP